MDPLPSLQRREPHQDSPAPVDVLGEEVDVSTGQDIGHSTACSVSLGVFRVAIQTHRRNNSDVSVTSRLLAAMNARDAVAVAACMAFDYDSRQPVHPSRAFRGRDQVHANWSEVFAGIPDFSAELLNCAVNDNVELAEWHWHGTHSDDGSTFEMRGATVFGVVDELVQWGRLYMEPVDLNRDDIQAMVRDTYRPPR